MVELSGRETQDFKMVMEWVKDQKWCNGKVGVVGMGSDGLAGAHLVRHFLGQLFPCVALLAGRSEHVSLAENCPPHLEFSLYQS